MSLKEYNKMQVHLFKKYKVSDSVNFFKVCSFISEFRSKEALSYSDLKKIISYIKNNF